MRSGSKKWLAVLAGLVAVGAGCSSSSKSTTNTTTAGNSQTANAQTINVGLLIDMTGAAASGNDSALKGFEAGIDWAKSQGYDIKYELADTASSPAGALAGAQKLVDEDHVDAVLVNSALTFAAAPWLNSHHIPVLGLAEDGPEWETYTNMFSVGGAIHTNVVSATYGAFFKKEGVTTVGTLGYGISPASSEYSKAAAVSSQKAGLKIGYENGNFTFGSTNVAPVALSMKNAGVDGVYAPVDPNTALALVTALRQLGDNPKAALFATGYGGDLLQGGPDAFQTAQGVYFTTGSEPVEMHTAATKQFQRYLGDAGVTTDPTVAEYSGYESIGLLLDGLKAAGSTVTTASLIAGLSTIHAFDNMGLWGGRTLDINNRGILTDGPDNCTYMTKVVGKAFQLVPGADPICGETYPGITVSASS